MKKELETKTIETVFADTSRGLGLMPVPINRDTQNKKKTGKGCTNSSTIENEENGKKINLKPRNYQPEVTQINQYAEKRLSNTQC